MEGRKLLLALALKNSNDWNGIFADLKNRYFPTDEEFANAENFTGNYITIVDEEYPKRLKQKYKPPFILYYDGDLSLLKRVDEHEGKNDLIFLHGPNTFAIPNNRLCIITADNKIDICGGLRVWFNKESTNVDRYGLAAGLCYNIVGTKIYPEDSHSWFLGITINNALAMRANVYLVGSSQPSYNNRLIKQGYCSLIDCYADLPADSSSGSNLPF